MVTLTPPPQQLPAKYLLRVYGTGVDEFLSREKELYWLSQLTSLGFGPQLYGIFGNGRLEEYLESTTLRRDDIRQPSVSKHIARRMSELHALVSYYRPYGRDGEKPELWGNVDSWLRLIRLRKWSSVLSACSANPQCMEILNSWPDLLALIDKLRELVDKANSPIVFAHADLQYGNILRLKDTGELAVVDFEYAGYNYRGFDIANHFCEWMADYHRDSDPHLLNEMDFPTESQRQAFLRTYRIAADVAAYEREIEPFIAASHLHWGLWGLIQAASSDIDFDYVGYATQRLSIFIRLLK
ncbi:kinase-like domain-containing protein [Coemansia mojavensis]|nr:kinase-like domain-containing protein [Coemansia mojavensis]